MTMISFNVGPSQVSDAVKQDIRDLAWSGLLSESHRGPAVKDVLLDTVTALRETMSIPDDYTVLFQPSATAAMELILRNCVETRSFHFVCGAFAERFAKTAAQIGLQPTLHETPWEEAPHPEQVTVSPGTELIAITHCETSTGQMWPCDELYGVGERFPDALVAVDVTSTFGALQMDWRKADFLFGSVQKCLGLPAGFGCLLVSPRAMERARQRGPARQVATWQDLPHMQQRIQTGETVETPNVLGIALLGRQMRRRDLAETEAETFAKARLIAERMGDEPFFIRDPAWRSCTAHNLEVADPAGWIARAKAAGCLVGPGYGKLRERCVRIATFPAVSLLQVEALMDVLEPR